MRELQGWNQGRRIGLLLLLASSAPAAIPALSSISCNPDKILAGQSTQCVVWMVSAAPAAGVVVALSVTGTGVSVPASVIIPHNQLAITFKLSTLPNAPSQTVVITGTANGISRSGSVQIPAAFGLQSLSCSQAQLYPGASTECTAWFTLDAPSATSANLSSSSPNLTVTPATMAVLKDIGAIHFTATASPTASADETATVTYTLASGSPASMSVPISIKAAPAFLLRGNAAEIAALTPGTPIHPTSMPPNVIGTLNVRGTGSMTFTPVTGSDGVAFHPGGDQNTNTAYLQFMGKGLQQVIAPSGEISFDVKSAYSLAQRKSVLGGAFSFMVDVLDGTRHLFSFADYVTSNGGLSFIYTAGGWSNSYAVPAGQEDMVFGAGKTLHVRIVWKLANGLSYLVYLNGVNVGEASSLPGFGALSSQAVLGVGAGAYVADPGHYASADAIANLRIYGAFSNSEPPTNSVPMAQDQSLTTPEDATKAIMLNATDADGDALIYSTVTAPTHGTLSGSGAALTYKPAKNYNGFDSFTFKANDGTTDSLPATVSISVSSINDPPVASFTPSPASGQAPLAVDFDASASSDDGSIASYTWTFGDEPPGIGKTVTHTYLAAGTYTAKLTVTDDSGVSASLSRTITVSAPVNSKPVAKPQSVTTLEDTDKAITLAGTDADGDDLTSWIVVAPAHGRLTGSNASQLYQPDFNYHGPDSFTFKVNDGTVDSLPAMVSIIVTSVNDPPTATFGANPSSGNAPLTVAFDASDSSDVDGTISSYQWAFGDGQTASGKTVSHTYTTSGSFSVVLTVTDNGTLTDQAAQSIAVGVDPNQPPVATPQNVSTLEDTAQTITFSGTDSNGDLLTFSTVTLPSHGTLSGSGATRIYRPATNYNGLDSFTFKANDKKADSPPGTISITITSVNDAPVSGFFASPTSGQAPMAVTFNAAASTDIDGTITSYAWDFGDGQFGSGASIVHTYTSAGLFSATLTVTDNETATGTATRLITINPPAVKKPNVILSVSGTAFNAPATVSLSGKAVAADHPIVKIEFFRDGNLLGGSAVNPAVFNWTEVGVGTYQLTAVATDSQGNQGTSDPVVVTVSDPNSPVEPLPDLSFVIPSLLSLQDRLSIDSYPAGNVSFHWTFILVGRAGERSPRFGAPQAQTIKTGAQTQSLASYGLEEGTYDVSVYAQDETDARRVSSTITGRVVLLTEVVSDFSALNVYPNPWRSDRSWPRRVTFAHLPVGSNIKIFTVSGHLVKKVAAAFDQAQWDLTTDSGDDVASGIYLYLVTDGRGNKTRGKLGIIK